jgi:hypothetical protein
LIGSPSVFFPSLVCLGNTSVTIGSLNKNNTCSKNSFISFAFTNSFVNTYKCNPLLFDLIGMSGKLFF